jgi:hypothetical protein
MLLAMMKGLISLTFIFSLIALQLHSYTHDTFSLDTDRDCPACEIQSHSQFEANYEIVILDIPTTPFYYLAYQNELVSKNKEQYLPPPRGPPLEFSFI